MYIALVFMGWISIFGASYDFETTEIFSFDQRAGKQLLWIGLSFLIAISIISIDSRIYDVFAYFIFGFGILMLLATFGLAHDIKGSRSWIVLGPLSIQPAEITKFTAALALSKVLSRYNFKLQGISSYIPAIAIIIFPMALILLQKETGSALVYLALFLVLYREGMPGVLLFLALCCVVLFIVVIRFGHEIIQTDRGSLGFLLAYAYILITQLGFVVVFEKELRVVKHILVGTLIVTAVSILLNLFLKIDYNYFALIVLGGSSIYLIYNSIQSRRSNYSMIVLFTIMAIAYTFSSNYIFEKVLEPHQQTRIQVVLGMVDDPHGDGYNVIQSKIAIGSGQFLGKGFLNGTQTKLKYVPEQDTDFIFCTVGEEYGFWGAGLVMGIYLLFMLRILTIAERQRENFARIYGYCVASIFFFHFTINIGMVLGIMPVIGIPLPFFSYGGSSLWGFTILLFILVRLDAARLEKMH